MQAKIKSFVIKSLRVWKILKKPSGMEFKTVSKVSAIGILALGVVGFVISLFMKLFF